MILPLVAPTYNDLFGNLENEDNLEKFLDAYHSQLHCTLYNDFFSINLKDVWLYLKYVSS